MARRNPDVEDIYVLSSMQQGILFHALRAPAPGLYCCQAVYGVRGPLDVRAFRRAWQRVFERHAVLRTSIVWKQLDVSVQVVHADVALPWTELDLRDLSAAAQHDAVIVYARADRQRGFDLSTAPLARLALVRLRDGDHRLIWTYHHIVLDGWSNWLVLKEAWASYMAYAANAEPALPTAPAFRDYIAWLRQHDPASDEQWWRERLQGASSTFLTGVSADRGDADADHADSTAIEASLDETEAMKQSARLHRVTMNTLLQGAWGLVMGRWTGRDDVVFGATISGRPETLEDAARMVGLFINTIPIRVRIDDRAPVASWLARVQRDWAETMPHAAVPLVQIATWSGVRQGAPLFDTVLVFENHPVDAFEQHYGTTHAARSHDSAFEVQAVESSESTNYAITLLANATRELKLRILFDRRFIDPLAAGRLLRSCMATIRALVARMDARVGDVEVFEAAEGHGAWNAIHHQWPERANLAAALGAQAACTPDAVAVIADGGHISYRALDTRANQLARDLVSRGVRPDTPVGVCLERGIDLVVALVGVLKAGGAYVPLDRSYPQARLAYMVANAGAQLVLSGGSDTCPIDLPAPGLPISSSSLADSAAPPGVSLQPAHLAYVIYTSGSTGQPKGAMNTHAGICNRLWWMQEAYGLRADDRVLQKTPISFDVSVWEFFWPLLTGATLVMARPGRHRDSRYLVDVIEAEQVTTVHFVPSMLDAFVRDPGAVRCASLRRVIASGEALAPALTGELRRRLPAAALHNLYGPTEAAVDVTAWSCEPTDGSVPVPIGRPITNTQVYVLDASGRPVPTGVPGELYLGGEGLARGYVNQPALTAERFLPDACSGGVGRRLYRTGDRGRWHPDGYLEYLGRLDHQVKIRGHRIELGEIEAVLASHRRVAQAAAAVQRTPAGDPQLVAYVVPAPAGTASNDAGSHRDLAAAELQFFLAARLPTHMIPAIVLMDALPQTASGKLDRRALPAYAPDPTGRAATRLLPRDSLEAHLMQIWEDLLDRRDLGVRDDFFDVGGHSLKALTLAARLSKAAGADVPLDAIFSRRTIEQLAAFLRQREPGWSAHRSTLVPIQTRGGRRPLFCVHPGSGLVHCYVNLSRHLGRDQPLYAFQSPALEFDERPITRVEAMAARYVEDLRAAHPTGPYQLAGLSMGAVVAFEMALQLEAAGVPVSLVALLDGTYPGTPAAEFDGGAAREIAAWGQRYVLRKAREELQLADQELAALSEEGRLARYLEGAKARDLIPSEVTVAQFRRFLQVFATNERAMSRYRPRRYDGRVAVVRCELAIDTALGWRRYAEMAESAAIGRRHGECIEEPAVRALAAFLREATDRAEIAAGAGTATASSPAVAAWSDKSVV